MSWLTGLRRKCWQHKMKRIVMLRMHTANGCAIRFEYIIHLPKSSLPMFVASL